MYRYTFISFLPHLLPGTTHHRLQHHPTTEARLFPYFAIFSETKPLSKKQKKTARENKTEPFFVAEPLWICFFLKKPMQVLILMLTFMNDQKGNCNIIVADRRKASSFVVDGINNIPHLAHHSLSLSLIQQIPKYGHIMISLFEAQSFGIGLRFYICLGLEPHIFSEKRSDHPFLERTLKRKIFHGENKQATDGNKKIEELVRNDNFLWVKKYKMSYWTPQSQQNEKLYQESLHYGPTQSHHYRLKNPPKKQ